MKYLLDTCFISELIKKKPNPGVINWLREKEESSLFISVITMGEIKKGIYKLPNSHKKDELEKWFIQLEKRFRNRIIPIDLEISIQWGQIQGELEQKGKSMPSIDALIASTGMAKNLTIITHNAKDIKYSRAEILDPWD